MEIITFFVVVVVVVVLAIINISCAGAAQYSHIKRHNGGHSKMVSIPAFCSECPKFNFQPSC